MVRGKVLEEGTKKPLEGMTVYLVEREADNTFSGQDGSFALPVGAPGDYSIVAAGPGYNKSSLVKISIGAMENIQELILYLYPIYSMTEVVVQEDRNPDKTGKTIISGKELASVPGSAGDPLRGLQALPGVTTANDASSVPAIRGSGPGNNALYVDFLPIGYLFHLGGLESVINPALVEDFNLYASSFGPEFADVTGGVIDVKLRNPRTDRLGGKINISTMETDALIEGPLAPNRSFYFGFRRSYIDLLLPKEGVTFNSGQVRQFPQYFDYQGKYVWKVSDNHSLTLQMSGADDRMRLTFPPDSSLAKHEPIIVGDYDFALSYKTLGAVMASRISPQVNNKFGLSYLNVSVKSRYALFGSQTVNNNIMVLRDCLTVASASNNDLFFGVDYSAANQKLSLDIPKALPSDWAPDPDYTNSERYIYHRRITTNSLGLDFKDRWRIVEPLTLIVGEKTSYDDLLGKHIIEPRLGAEYYLQKNTLITAGWGKYHQLPPGLMVLDGLGNPRLDYEKADHTDLGVERQLDDGWSVKVDEYYKRLSDLVVPHQPENFINSGSGKAYGTELLIKKKMTANWWGWFSAAYAKTERRNDVTHENVPYRYDQPLIFNIVYNWKITPKWTFGAKWRYQSGAPITPVVGHYTDPADSARELPIYGALNSERLPAYHRLDLRISREVWSGLRKTELYVELINAYNHNNVSDYDYNADYTSRTPVTELPLMPAFGFQMEF